MSVAPSPVRLLRDESSRALLGTDRSGGGKDAAVALLARVGVAGARARAGRRHSPAQGQGAMPECPVDARPAAARAAHATLERLLGDPDASLIEEWAELALAMGVRIPDALAPRVLEWWSTQPKRSELVFGALGTRGPWLATLNPAWSKPIATDDIPSDAERLWQEGSGAERAALLKTIRRQKPEWGLALVQSTWSSDGADDKRRFLDAMLTGLSLADEQLLESSLKDRAKSVRTQAAALLARLPESRFKQRANQRLASLVRVETKRTGVLRRASTVVSVEPPTEFDEAWELDGIEAPAPSGKGKRAWWLQQIVTYADPAVLGTITGLEPGALIAAMAENDYSKEILAGLAAALTFVPHERWIVSLTEWSFEERHQGAKRAVAPEALWPMLPRAAFEAIVLDAVRNPTLPADERAFGVLLLPTPWSADFSARLVDALRKSDFKLRYEDFYSGAVVSQLAARLHPSAANAFEGWLAGTMPKQSKELIEREHLPKALARLHLRAEMHKEFST